ncbi:MAG: flagellar basal body protein [Candidatus Gastranaerophilales bacterium]|nr:flagellar basal body protein [Candidatus Gastranaerophilales bacterium]
MDLIGGRYLDISELALDGLSQRNRILASNIANANTEGYQRIDVKFEDQLAEIIKKDDENKNFANQNSLKYVPTSSDAFLDWDKNFLQETQQKMKFNQNPYKDFAPELYSDNSSAMSADGNNVNIEKEMVELTKNGTKYTVLTDIESKIYKKIENILKSSG